MTELELYKFIHENGVEWRWDNNAGHDDVIIFPYIFWLEDFCKLIKDYEGSDGGGVPARIMNGYAAIWMVDLCEYFGIEIENVFKRDNQ
jgi:hypothetical protein